VRSRDSLLSEEQSISQEETVSAGSAFRRGPVYQLPAIVHALTRIDFASANRTGFVGRVIFVMIVILKSFYETKQNFENKLKEIFVREVQAFRATLTIYKSRPEHFQFQSYLVFAQIKSVKIPPECS
jgi:hypothetical protein